MSLKGLQTWQNSQLVQPNGFKTPQMSLCLQWLLRNLLSYRKMYHQMQIYLQQEIKWPLGLICHLFSCSGVCTLPLKWGLHKVLRAWPLSRGISSSACQLRARLHLLIRIYFSLLLLTLFALKVKVKERFTSTKYQQNICWDCKLSLNMQIKWLNLGRICIFLEYIYHIKGPMWRISRDLLARSNQFHIWAHLSTKS